MSRVPPTPLRGLPRLAGLATLAVFLASRLYLLSVPSEKEFDEGVYLLSARSVLAGHELFREVFSSQPPAFLEALAAALGAFGDSLETGRLLILALAITTALATADLARRAGGPVAWAFALAACCFSVTFLDLAHVVQADSPSVAFAVIALAVAARARAAGWSLPAASGVGALFGTALAFKLIAAPLSLPLLVLLLLGPGEAWVFDRPSRSSVRVLVAATLASLVVGLPFLFYDRAAMWEQTVAFHLAKHRAFPFSPLANAWRLGDFAVDHAVMVAFATGGSAALLRSGRSGLGTALWAWAWVAASAAAIVLQTPLFWRHFVLLVPPLALLAGCGAAALWEGARSKGSGSRRVLRSAVLAGAATLVVHGLYASSASELFAPWSLEARLRRSAVQGTESAARFVAERTSAGDTVVSDDPLVVYLAGRQAPPFLCDTSLARIHSRWLTLADLEREGSGAAMVVARKSGRLSRVRGLARWLAEDFEKLDARRIDPRGNRAFWSRRGVGPASAPTEADGQEGQHR